MENASKGLLIAAAVLIAIILVSFGIKVLNSSNDTKQHAQSVGSGISTATQDAKDKFLSSMGSGGTLKIGDVITTDELLAKLKIDNYTGSYKGDWVVIGKESGKTKLLTLTNVESNIIFGWKDYSASTDPDRAMNSYKNAAKRLDSIAQEKLGNIANKTKVRSVTVEDINELEGKKPSVNDNSNYGKQYKFCWAYIDNNVGYRVRSVCKEKWKMGI